MQPSIRLALAVVLLATVAACSKQETKPTPPTEQPTTTTQEPTQPEVKTVDPRDYSDARNLDNPESLLSKRHIFFDFDQYNIRPEGRDVIAAHAAYLRSHSSARVTLEGHADERGSREYNLALGERRSSSVSSALSAQGASGNQQELVSYGEERPYCTESDEACWQRNRRVEIVYISR